MADWFRINIQLPEKYEHLKKEIIEKFQEDDYDFPSSCFNNFHPYRSPRIDATDILKFLKEKFDIDDVPIYFGEDCLNYDNIPKFTYKDVYAKELKLNKFKEKIQNIINAYSDNKINLYASVRDDKEHTIYWSIYTKSEHIEIKISCDEETKNYTDDDFRRAVIKIVTLLETVERFKKH